MGLQLTETIDDKVDWDDLPNGTIFAWKDIPFIKVNSFSSKGQETIAVSLSSGHFVNNIQIKTNLGFYLKEQY